MRLGASSNPSDCPTLAECPADCQSSSLRNGQAVNPLRPTAVPPRTLDTHSGRTNTHIGYTQWPYHNEHWIHTVAVPTRTLDTHTGRTNTHIGYTQWPYHHAHWIHTVAVPRRTLDTLSGRTNTHIGLTPCPYQHAACSWYAVPLPQTRASCRTCCDYRSSYYRRIGRTRPRRHHEKERSTGARAAEGTGV